VSGYDQAVQAAAEAVHAKCEQGWTHEWAGYYQRHNMTRHGVTEHLAEVEPIVAAAVPVIRRQVLEEAADELLSMGSRASLNASEAVTWGLAVMSVRALAVSDEQEQQP